MRKPFLIGDGEVAPGTRETVELFTARLYTHTEITMPVEVVHAQEDGPAVFLSAALHGDEINGVEIIRRVMSSLDVSDVRGTILSVPVVNVFGFVYQSRYLPDRRDLNRSFPGSRSGSQASQLAYLFMHEVVNKCQYGLDLHTAAPPRTNLPQIRTNLNDPETRRIAEAFGAPVMMGSAGPDRSLRRVAARKGVHILVYEAGEPQRFNHDAINLGVDGVRRALAAIGVTGQSSIEAAQTQVASRTTWVRARQSGIARLSVRRGDSVEKGDELAVIGDPFGDSAVRIRAPWAGMVIGHTLSPLVHRGEAVIHLAEIESE